MSQTGGAGSPPDERTQPKVGTREQWLAARLDLMEREKELTRLGDEVARQRSDLPWVRVEKDHVFETESGEKSLAELFLSDLPGLSAFARHDGLVFHTYSCYARGGEFMMLYYPLLDRVPMGRNEGSPPEAWIRRRDEY